MKEKPGHSQRCSEITTEWVLTYELGALLAAPQLVSSDTDAHRQGKVDPGIDHDGYEGEYSYSYTLSFLEIRKHMITLKMRNKRIFKNAK